MTQKDIVEDPQNKSVPPLEPLIISDKDSIKICQFVNTLNPRDQRNKRKKQRKFKTKYLKRVAMEHREAAEWARLHISTRIRWDSSRDVFVFTVF